MLYVIEDNNTGKFLTVTCDSEGCYELDLIDHSTNFASNVAIFNRADVEQVLKDIHQNCSTTRCSDGTVFTILHGPDHGDFVATSLSSFSQRDGTMRKIEVFGHALTMTIYQ